jgi:exopolyphosphatase/guanosine-5'-triphosphate,3'-diphosphate pyrophosphatase
MARILAAADIGSNTAHMLIARTDGSTITRIDNSSDWIALGEVVARMGVIPPAHITRIVSTLKRFKTLASKALAEELVVFATEAMRVAKNHTAVLDTIKAKTGIRVKLITPQQEAYYSLRGVMLDVAPKQSAMFFEVGGGSAQIAVYENEKMRKDASIPIGTGRLIVEAGLTNPCTDEAKDHAIDIIEKALDLCPSPLSCKFGISSGGVGRGIWRSLHPDGDKQIHLEEIDYLIWGVSRLSIDQITQRFGVKGRRAETLLPGALVYRALLHRYELREMTISEFGVREGAILDVFQGKTKAQVL